jgi:hypothetical protein
MTEQTPPDVAATSPIEAPLRGMLAVRLEGAYLELVRQLQERHGVSQFAKYLRGLIYADAVRSGLPVVGLDVPGWLSSSYPELFAAPAPAQRKPQKHGRKR